MDHKQDIQNIDGLKYMKTVPDGSVDLILTDPPYIISKDSGMDSHYNNIKNNESSGTNIKTEAEWEKYVKLGETSYTDQQRVNYIKYGSIYGKKYCVRTQFGDWDSDFTMDVLDTIIKVYYSKLRKGGTCIIFFDLWKIGELKQLLEKHKFKQIRLIEWIKTNPQPRNSSVNYLTNCREVAVLAVKVGKPTFNSSYDKGIYEFPIQGGKNRCHPTQKNVDMFEALITKHSNPNDVVMDTFLGSGTTALACYRTNRIFIGCEIERQYYDHILKILTSLTSSDPVLDLVDNE